jgi:uncharacterized RDD family membrane protein YckC
MTKCSHCDQPVHPQQATCGSCGERLDDTDARTGGADNETTIRTGGADNETTIRTGGADNETMDPAARDDREDARPIGAEAANTHPGNRPADAEGTARVAGSEDGLPSLRPPDGAPPRSQPPHEPSSGPLPHRSPPKRPKGSAPAFLSRFWALIVDFAVLSVASSVLPAVIRMGIRAAEAASGAPEMYDDLILAKLEQLAWPGLVAGYFVFVPAAGGQTIGKGLMGLVVVRLDGAPMDVRTTVLRTIGYAFSLASFGIGFLCAAFPPRRGLHDYLAGTIVLRLRDLPLQESEESHP